MPTKKLAHNFKSIFIALSLALLCPLISYAKELQTIKVALLDTFYNEMPLIPQTSKYEKAYFAGVETAGYEAKKYGLQIKYKPFIYGTGPLDILHEIPKVQAWGADLVMGPNASDQCLLLGHRLQGVMTLSSYASDVHLKTLSSNFYSTLLPDDQIMALLANYIHEKFPNKNIYVVEKIDSKQCVDAGKLFISSIKKISPHIQIFQQKILMNNINNINSKKLMSGHENDVTLIFNSTYYGYISFVHHIAASFPNKKLIFFSDQDNWSSEVDGHTHKFDLSFESYRIGPTLFNRASLTFNKFMKAYQHLYHKEPKDAISYMTYYALMSAIVSLNKFPDPNHQETMRKKILYSYHAALKKYPNWFRGQDFGIYQLTSKGEVLVKRISVEND